LQKLFIEEDLIPIRQEDDFFKHYIFELWSIVSEICNKTVEVQGGMLTLE